MCKQYIPNSLTLQHSYHPIYHNCSLHRYLSCLCWFSDSLTLTSVTIGLELSFGFLGAQQRICNQSVVPHLSELIIGQQFRGKGQMTMSPVPYLGQLLRGPILYGPSAGDHSCYLFIITVVVSSLESGSFQPFIMSSVSYILPVLCFAMLSESQRG